jgi:hypothetical protein
MIRLLALSLLLAFAGCKASPEVVAKSAIITTVQTIQTGLELFRAWEKSESERIKVDVIAACRQHETPAAYKACTEPLLDKRYAPIHAATDAIKVYDAALAAGQGIAEAAPAVIRALAVLGIKIGGSP